MFLIHTSGEIVPKHSFPKVFCSWSMLYMSVFWFITFYLIRLFIPWKNIMTYAIKALWSWKVFIALMLRKNCESLIFSLLLIIYNYLLLQKRKNFYAFCMYLKLKYVSMHLSYKIILKFKWMYAHNSNEKAKTNYM